MYVLLYAQHIYILMVCVNVNPTHKVANILICIFVYCILCAQYTLSLKDSHLDLDFDRF